MEAIRQAITEAAEAGKLRQYVRLNGGTGLAGLIRLADRHSAASKAALETLIRGAAPVWPVARLVVTDRPGSR